MPTLADLDDLMGEVNQLVQELIIRLYPNGKPDWMPQEDWDNINGKTNG